MKHSKNPGLRVPRSLVEPHRRRLATWLPEIVAKLRPGAPIHHNGDEIRVGNKGSLALYRDGGWYDFEADHGGPDAWSFITHELRDQEPGSTLLFALDWLTEHAGSGSFEPDQINADAAKARAEKHAAWAREILERMQPLEGTDSEANLVSRGLPGPYPGGLLGHLPDARLGESAMVAKLTDAEGNILGVQLSYLAKGGTKSVLVPQRNVFWIETDPEKRKAGLFRIPPAPRSPGNG